MTPTRPAWPLCNSLLSSGTHWRARVIYKSLDILPLNCLILGIENKRKDLLRAASVDRTSITELHATNEASNEIIPFICEKNKQSRQRRIDKNDMCGDELHSDKMLWLRDDDNKGINKQTSTNINCNLVGLHFWLQLFSDWNLYHLVVVTCWC